MFYYLPNLSAVEVQPCEPWTAQSTLPPLADKTAYRQWCNDPTTDHAFITACEGRTPGIRVSETNPVARMAGLIIDYDAVPDLPPEQSIMAKAPSDLRPAYVSRTFSGHCRVLYRFETPVAVFTPDIARQFVLKLQRELKLRKLLAGYEEEALIDLSKHYEIGRDWTPIGSGDNVIPSNLLMAWLAEASAKHKWEREGPTIPIDVIREEAMKRWPTGWPNGWSTFDLGARGPRFWDEDASDPTAAVVRESGIQYYSDGGGFVNWETMFGSQFVRRWSDNRIGGAINSYYLCGTVYWTKDDSGKWSTRVEREVHRSLRCDHRLFKKSASPTEENEVERALNAISKTRRVDAALPHVFKPDGELLVGTSSKILNISTLRPVTPVNDITEWGEGFPRLANWFGNALAPVPGTDGQSDPSRQLNHLLAFIRHFYVGGLNQDPQRGLALFLAGPTSAGKNFFNKGVLGQLMGGSQDASKYLMSEDKYNDELFGVAHWRIDDAVASGDEKDHRRFSQMVKQIVANDSLVYRRMYSGGRDVQWLGRVVVTLNDDPESLRVLPQTDIHILDKIMLLKLQTPPPGWEMTDAQIAVELPYFAAFLRDWTPPAYCIPADPRFGVAAYAHPELLASANSTNVTASFEELLLLWRDGYFAPGGAGESLESWVGNPTELTSSIYFNDGLRHASGRQYTSVQIGIHLSKLAKQGRPYLTRLGDRRYAIAKP